MRTVVQNGCVVHTVAPMIRVREMPQMEPKATQKPSATAIVQGVTPSRVAAIKAPALSLNKRYICAFRAARMAMNGGPLVTRGKAIAKPRHVWARWASSAGGREQLLT